MSLDSAGWGVRLNVDNGDRKELGYGHDDDIGQAFMKAMEAFIKTEEFKEMTHSLYGSIDIRMSFLLHTKMPR